MAKANWPEHEQGKAVDMITIYNKLRNATQDATEDSALYFDYASTTLKKQIQLDVKYLHSEICPKSKQDPIKELKFKGYL